MESKYLIGTWAVNEFEVKGYKTPIRMGKNFKFNIDGTYEETYPIVELSMSLRLLKRWEEDDGGISLYSDEVLDWQVVSLTESTLILYQVADEITYYCIKVQD